AIARAGVELTVEPEQRAACASLALARRANDRGLYVVLLPQNAADRGVRLAADGLVLALLDQLAALLLRDERCEIGQLEVALHALLVGAVRLTGSGAAARVLDHLPRAFDGLGILTLGRDARRMGRVRGEDDNREDSSKDPPHGTTLLLRWRQERHENRRSL